jgi:hypothetical protein
MTKQDLKNNLRNQICKNCALYYDGDIGSDWCVMRKKRPKSRTCLNWQQSEKFIYTFSNEKEMNNHLVEGKDLFFEFNTSFTMKGVEIRSPDGTPLYYVKEDYEFPDGGGTLTLKAPTTFIYNP